MPTRDRRSRFVLAITLLFLGWMALPVPAQDGEGLMHRVRRDQGRVALRLVALREKMSHAGLDPEAAPGENAETATADREGVPRSPLNP